MSKYFDQAGGRYIFKKDLRRSIIFGRHDLLQDAPISRADLVTCRNTLMYFNAEAQTRILNRFAFALNDGGILFLGKAETLLSRMDLFQPVDLKRRLFSKVARTIPRDRFNNMVPQITNGYALNHVEDHRLREVALDVDPVAHILVDFEGKLALANEAARALFSINFADFGRPLQDLEISYRPVELRSLIEEAYLSRRPVAVKDVPWPPSSANARYFDLSVIPLFEVGGSTLGAKAVYTDVTRFHRMQEELQQSHQELETAYEELQSANEELETTNEELQSTVEELETTNEELQSTNEELETMNEELQSTNEELEATNETLRQREAELSEASSFNELVMNRMLDGLAVVDRELRVTAWNRRAEDLWGLRADEVTRKNLLNLDIGLPVHELRQPIRSILSGEKEVAEVTLPATNRRGRTIELHVTLTPLNRTGQEPQGVVMMQEELGTDNRRGDGKA